MIKLNGLIVKPTMFPDGTSQIWKLPENKVCNPEAVIEWDFENEAEIIHVLQLADLVNACTAGVHKVKLYMPYLPYGRQDKNITNYRTFALRTFLGLLIGKFDSIKIIDAHNPSVIGERVLLKVDNVIPNERISNIIEETKPNLICFPDAGASNRGYDIGKLNSFNLEKNRNELTGEILGLKTELPLNLKGLKILIIDDICDGGRTFIEASKVLYEMGAEEVNLYTTHGLYTKGTNCLFESGIKRIFNFKEEVTRQS